MKLDEIMNHNEPLIWQKNGRFELSSFVIDNVSYQIQIDRKPLDNKLIELHGKKTAEVSFYRSDIANDDHAHSTTNDAKKTPVKVYGAVLSGLKKKFHDYDAFYFSAERKHSATTEEYESKQRIYFYMVDRLSKEFTTTKYSSPDNVRVFFYELEDAYGAKYLVSKIQLSDKSKEDTGLKHALSEAIKACGMGKGFY